MARRKRKAPVAHLYVQAPAWGKRAVKRHRDLLITVTKAATTRQKSKSKKARKARRRPGKQGILGFLTAPLRYVPRVM
jgi:hypothetical protein